MTRVAGDIQSSSRQNSGRRRLVLKPLAGGSADRGSVFSGHPFVTVPVPDFSLEVNTRTWKEFYLECVISAKFQENSNRTSVKFFAFFLHSTVWHHVKLLGIYVRFFDALLLVSKMP